MPSAMATPTLAPIPESAPASVAIVVPPPKPGWKTTEFWLTLLALGLTQLYASGVTDSHADSSWVKAIAFFAAALTAAGYAVSRGKVKAG